MVDTVRTKSAFKANVSVVGDRAEVVDKKSRIRGQVTTGRGELLSFVGSSARSAIERHRKVHDSSREAVGQLWKRMAIIFQGEAMHMQMRVYRAVHKAMRDDTTHIKGVQEDVPSKLFEAVEIAVSVVDDACEETALEVVVE